MKIVRLSPENKPPHGTVNLRDVWRLLKVHKWILGFLAFSALSVATLYFIVKGPRYRASVTLTVSSAPSSMKDMLVLDGNEEMSNKISILSELFYSSKLSHTVLNAVVAKGRGLELLSAPTGYRRILVALGVLSRFIPAEQADDLSDDDRAGSVMAHLSIIPNVPKQQIIVVAETPQPAVSAFLANVAAKALVDENEARLLIKIREIKIFLKEQTVEIGGKLETLEAELVTFQKANHMTSGDESERGVYNLVNRNEEQLVNLEVQYNSTKQLKEKFESELKKVKESLDNPSISSSNMYLSQLQHRLSMLQYQNALSKSAITSSLNTDIETEIKNISASYKKALESRGELNELAIMTPLEYYQQLEKSLAQLRKDERKMQSELSVLLDQRGQRKDDLVNLSTKLQKLTELKRNISLTSDLYIGLRKKLQDTEIQEAATLNDVAILSKAMIPSRPANLPLRFVLLIALGLSLGAGAFGMYVVETFIPFVRNKQDLESMGIPVLAEIPEIGGDEGMLPLKLIRPDKSVLVLEKRPLSYEADIIRSIRLRMSAAENAPHNASQGAQVLQVTSAKPGCGKTFVSCNLAFALAKARHKTLLIDLDVRQPSVQHFFANTNKRQIDLKAAEMSALPDDIINQVSPHLDVVFSAPFAAPVDFLESNLVRDFLERMKKKYEFIIIDSTPILGLIDAGIVAQYADRFLFVVEHRRTFREDVISSVEKLKEYHEGQVFGVLNRVHLEFTNYGTVNEYYYHKVG